LSQEQNEVDKSPFIFVGNEKVVFFEHSSPFWFALWACPPPFGGQAFFLEIFYT